MAFTFAYTLDGSTPIIEDIAVKDTIVLSINEMVNLESGEVDTAATGDTALAGVCIEAVDNTNDGLTAPIITNKNAVYAVTDANARVKGATLDIGTGGLTVAATSNADLIVVEDSTASEETLVTFNNTHYLD